MRLLFVIDCLGSGGAQRQMVNLALGLLKRGHCIEFFVYYPEITHFAPLLEDAGIKIHASRKTGKFSLSVVANLRTIIHAGHYDLVLSFLMTPNFYTILANCSLFHHPGFIVSERSYDLGRSIPWMERITRSMYRFASHVIANSNHQRENLERKYPFMRKKISTIYNGYDLEYFAPEEPSKIVDNSDLKLLVIASISPGKNGLCLVRALNIMRQSYGILPIVSWVGEQVMSGERLSYRQKMDYEIAEFGLSTQWNWLGQRTDIVELINNHDLLVHPSYGEGLPNVVCEALACGKPVIASNMLDHPRLVQDGITGYLFDWQNPEDLAQKIITFAQLPNATRSLMRQNARHFAESHLSMSRFVDEYETLFETLLNR